jgi:hypothetical protein
MEKIKYIIVKRNEDMWYKFKDEDIYPLYDKDWSINYNMEHGVLRKGVRPDTKFDNSKRSNDFAIDLWNEIFDDPYKVSKSMDFKSKAQMFIRDTDAIYINGYGAPESVMMQYVTAQSASSFIGIQDPALSYFAYDSMVKTIEAHCNPKFSYKPWLIENLRFVESHIRYNPHIMERKYADMCLHAKVSSASIKGYSDFRSFVFNNTLDDIMKMLMDNKIPFELYAGTRSDRRGKYRLICSFHGVIRVLDFMFHNGTYQLCEGDGILSEYTTEGFTDALLWKQMKQMSTRDGYSLLCLDYTGYDTQISNLDYLNLSRLVNTNLIGSPESYMGRVYLKYLDWMLQPKPLLTRINDRRSVLIPLFRTLYSGAHATHSGENLIGISTFLECQKRFREVNRLWTNGDDQNIKVSNESVPDVMEFMNNNFNISWDKSLVGHRLGVWSKLWFAQDIHPMWEIGTFRGIWEKEGESKTLVVDSKLQSIYCKIIQVVITLIRLNKDESTIDKWINILCDECRVRHDRLPVSLFNISIMKIAKNPNHSKKIGLESARFDLEAKSFDLNIASNSSYYDMLNSMATDKWYFDFNTETLLYYRKDTVMSIDSLVDYSYNIKAHVPYSLKKLFQFHGTDEKFSLIQALLQGTKSYDGPVSGTFTFTDIKSLAIAINNRNSRAWDDQLLG